MKKLLIYSDSPHATTGLGRLMRYMIPHLQEKFEITMVAINHKHVEVLPSNEINPIYDKEKYKIKLYSTYLTGDDWGYNIIKQLLKSKTFDYVLTSHDYNRITPIADDINESRLTNGTKWINYMPVDKAVMDVEVGLISMPDHIVFLSEYGQRQVITKDPKLADKTSVIYHPLDLSEFPILDKKGVQKFKAEYFTKFDQKDFIITNINRNIFRKDMGKTVAGFNIASKKFRKARLYMHCQDKMGDQHGGANFSIIVGQLSLNPELMALPDITDEINGVPQEDLNKIYQASDLFVTTSKGEGFGYTTVEALATETPIIAPNNTTFPELVQNFGYITKVNDYNFEYFMGNVKREETDVEDLADKILYVKKNYNEAKEKAKEGRKWVEENLNIETIMKKWDEVFQTLE